MTCYSSAVSAYMHIRQKRARVARSHSCSGGSTRRRKNIENGMMRRETQTLPRNSFSRTHTLSFIILITVYNTSSHIHSLQNTHFNTKMHTNTPSSLINWLSNSNTQLAHPPHPKPRILSLSSSLTHTVMNPATIASIGVSMWYAPRSAASAAARFCVSSVLLAVPM
jgi:hypothetical protein